MGKLTRFGVSIDRDLLLPFDKLIQQKGYATRSEAIRDLIRADLLQNQWNTAETGGGTMTLVYDHHKHDLSRKIMRLEHSFHDIIITTMHVHLDHHNCLEVIVLKGDCARILTLVQSLSACRGVVFGAFNPAPIKGDLVE